MWFNRHTCCSVFNQLKLEFMASVDFSTYKMKVVAVLLLLCFIVSIAGRLRIIPDERFENCDESPSEGYFRFGNISDLFAEFDLDENEKIILNYNLTLKVPVSSEKKLFMRLVGHQYYMATWQPRFIHTYTDACKDFFKVILQIHPIHLPKTLNDAHGKKE